MTYKPYWMSSWDDMINKLSTHAQTYPRKILKSLQINIYNNTYFPTTKRLLMSWLTIIKVTRKLIWVAWYLFDLTLQFPTLIFASQHHEDP